MFLRLLRLLLLRLLLLFLNLPLVLQTRLLLLLGSLCHFIRNFWCRLQHIVWLAIREQA